MPFEKFQEALGRILQGSSQFVPVLNISWNINCYSWNWSWKRRNSLKEGNWCVQCLLWAATNFHPRSSRQGFESIGWANSSSFNVHAYGITSNKRFSNTGGFCCGDSRSPWSKLIALSKNHNLQTNKKKFKAWRVPRNYYSEKMKWACLKWTQNHFKQQMSLILWMGCMVSQLASKFAFFAFTANLSAQNPWRR